MGLKSVRDFISFIHPSLSGMLKNLNFSTITNEEDDYEYPRKKTARDPMSHRIIEKRRRDRMNNCLADLSRLVPTNYLKKGRGRIEKTEIIEMAIKHLKHLQNHPCNDPNNCEVARTTESDHKRQYKSGYSECLNEAVKYVSDNEGMFSSTLVGRMSEHLIKHFEKLGGGGLLYTKALGIVLPEDSKPAIHMEVDNHSNSCYLPDPVINLPPHNGHPFSYEHRNSEVPEMKQEMEFNGHLSSPQSLTPIKATSQLREMLQNPGVPLKDSLKPNPRSCNGTPAPVPSPMSQPVSVVVPPDHHNEVPKQEEGYYKFKNNIKHRFNNDIRHHTSSPTDSHHSDRMSLPDEDHNNNKLHVPEPYPLRPCHPAQSPDERLVPNGLCNGNSNTGHAFSPYSSNRLSSELTVKIPERTMHPENGALPSSYGTQHWDSQAETASSCGSNPSPPPNASRSNGSSSGYSTNGENNSSSSLHKPHNGTLSPTLSPYSRTPDRLSNRSPSPIQSGVPIFALHPKGTFYIPLTIESSILVPYLAGVDDLTPVLHPISICVNLSNNSVKVEKLNDTAPHHYRSSFLMSKYQERYVFPERPVYYPCPTSPPRNTCS
ncbi:transcription factor cwo isoform X1 [Parasteatoda tepidariorum]|uniref:transcription factor cwo isoform X1 n=1 Tax=Parasteatoda tepidariorum TaxID=114398 RepID=UPI0039BCED17